MRLLHLPRHENDSALFDAIRHVAECKFGVPVTVGPIDLGYLPGYGDLSRGHVDGLYNSERHDIRINCTSQRKAVTLLHELTHAIDPDIADGKPMYGNVQTVAADDLVAETVAYLVASLLDVDIRCWCPVAHQFEKAMIVGVDPFEVERRVRALIHRLYEAIVGTPPDRAAIARLFRDGTFECKQHMTFAA